MFSSRHRRRYALLLSVLAIARRFGGIAAPLSTRKLSLMSCPLGLNLGWYPFCRSSSIESLYGQGTLRLLALGQGVFESHHTQFTASFTRIRRTVTHSAGDGS